MVSDRVIAGDEDLGFGELLQGLIRSEDRREQLVFVHLAVCEGVRT